MEHKILKCGHAANAEKILADGTKIPSCVICDCTEESEIQPLLENRMAKCGHFGLPVSRRNNETKYPKLLTKNALGETCCGSIVSSNNNLPFFQYRPDKEYDEFYCGCQSWD